MATTPKPTILKSSNATASGAEAASVSSGAASSVPPQPAKSSLLRWILIGACAVILLALLAVAGWWWKRHAHGHAASAATSTNGAAKKAVASKPVPPTATVELPLEPFVVNLADAGGHSYARIGLTLRLAAPDGGKEKDAKKEGAAGNDDLRDVARDTIIGVLNQQQSSDLLAAGGKDHLKQLLRQAMIARDPRLQVVDIYFTEFLVQP